MKGHTYNRLISFSLLQIFYCVLGKNASKHIQTFAMATQNFLKDVDSMLLDLIFYNSSYIELL